MQPRLSNHLLDDARVWEEWLAAWTCRKINSEKKATKVAGDEDNWARSALRIDSRTQNIWCVSVQSGTSQFKLIIVSNSSPYTTRKISFHKHRFLLKPTANSQVRCRRTLARYSIHSRLLIGLAAACTSLRNADRSYFQCSRHSKNNKKRKQRTGEPLNCRGRMRLSTLTYPEREPKILFFRKKRRRSRVLDRLNAAANDDWWRASRGKAIFNVRTNWRS